MTEPVSSTESAGPRWRLIAAVALIAAALICAAVLFTSTDNSTPHQPKPSETAEEEGTQEAAASARDALATLADTSAEVTASVNYTTLAELEASEEALGDRRTVDTVPGTDPDEWVGEVGGSLILETGVVDFAANSALGGLDGGVIPPSVTVEGTTYLDFSTSPLSASFGVDGWVETPAETAVGIDVQSTTLRTLLDVVAAHDLWIGDTAVPTGEFVFTVPVDSAALAARDQERLAALGDPLASLITAELTTGTRAVAGENLQVTVGADGYPTRIRLEIDSLGQVATLTWDLSNFGVAVDTAGAVPEDAMPYADYSAALAVAMDVSTPPADEDLSTPPEDAGREPGSLDPFAPENSVEQGHSDVEADPGG